MKKMQASPEEFRVAREMRKKGYSYFLKFSCDERLLYVKRLTDIGPVLRDYQESRLELAGEIDNIVLEEK